MLAVIAGTGDLPAALVDRLRGRGEMPLICELDGFAPDVPADLPRIRFRIETIGTLLATLAVRGVDRVCLAGAVRRPALDPAAIDGASAPLVARLAAAMGLGDDGALREIVAIFEERGLTVVGAADLAPDLLPAAGCPTRRMPGPEVAQLAELGARTVARMGREDRGQACIVAPGVVVAEEGPEGTDALIGGLPPHPPRGSILYKAPKPDQERRVDLPLIGPETARQVVKADLDGIVIEAGGVLVLDLDRVVATLDSAGRFLWVREAGP